MSELSQNHINIRVRFAPSPTGYLHVGNARTAILNWLFARHCGGSFILRVEDTDMDRSTTEYYKELLDDLKWLGLDWDEGPDVGGDFGPYKQSDRLQIYQDYANKLLAQGNAFKCYCTAEEIKEKSELAISKGESVNYDGTCYQLSQEQIRQFESQGRKPVIRFRVPSEEISFSDIVRGTITFDGDNISDFVILRAVGIATYNFAAAVDDTLMSISHIVRGEDHLSNTPKQILIHNALGHTSPNFVHIPMILGSDRSKLSKRHGDNQVRQYREKGYFPEALVNFLSLLSWSSPTGDELLSMKRLVEEFTLERLSKSAAIFDLEKFNWMNGWYLRNIEFDKITNMAIPFLEKEGYDISDETFTKKCIVAVITRADYLQELATRCSIFFQDEVMFENDTLMKSESSKKIFAEFLNETKNITDWRGETFKQIMKTIQQKTGVKGKDLWMPFRMALTGLEHGLELPNVVELLGLEKSKQFIQKAINT